MMLEQSGTSVCDFIHLFPVCFSFFIFAYLVYTQRSAWTLFQSIHKHLCEQANFSLNSKFSGGSRWQQRSWRTCHLRNTKIHTEMQMFMPWKDYFGATWLGKQGESACRCQCVVCMCVWGHACAWIPLVWCDEKRLSPSGSLLRRTSNAKCCQRGCIRTCVCACTLKPSKCSRWKEIQVHDSNVTPLLLLAFRLPLFYTNPHFHLILLTASGVF